MIEDAPPLPEIRHGLTFARGSQMASRSVGEFEVRRRSLSIFQYYLVGNLADESFIARLMFAAIIKYSFPHERISGQAILK